MTGWNEDNFLEKMIQLLGQRSGTAPCPEAAAFLAASDGDASGALKKAMTEHASRCPDCWDIQQRMERFDAAMVTDQDAEWKQTERRLDDWLESFLASDAAAHHQRDRVSASRLRLWWTRLTSPSVVRQLRWALVPAVTLALVICSFLAGRVSVRRPPQVTAEVKRLPAATIPPRAVAEQQSSEKELTGNSQVSRTPHSPSKPAEGAAVGSIAPRRISPPSGSSTAPEDGVRPTETAAVESPASSSAEKAPISSPPEPLQAPPGESASVTQTAPPEGATRPVETAATGRPCITCLRVSSARPNGAVQTPKTSVAAPSVGPAGPGAPAAAAGHSQAIPAPPVIRLDAGTRVWITLRSVRPRADGVSEFRGTVLLPVTQSGATVLGRNTEVPGTMTVSNGKRSVQILEFLSAGAHYKLRGASGEANLRLLGAGEVVQFDAGRVLETWMSVVSTYEKQPGESKPPE